MILQIRRSQRTQIIRHITESFQHLGIAEIAFKHSVGSPAAMPSSMAMKGSAT
jgi:hypothetical protein